MSTLLSSPSSPSSLSSLSSSLSLYTRAKLYSSKKDILCLHDSIIHWRNITRRRKEEEGKTDNGRDSGDEEGKTHLLHLNLSRQFLLRRSLSHWLSITLHHANLFSMKSMAIAHHKRKIVREVIERMNIFSKREREIINGIGKNNSHKIITEKEGGVVQMGLNLISLRRKRRIFSEWKRMIIAIRREEYYIVRNFFTQWKVSSEREMYRREMGERKIQLIIIKNVMDKWRKTAQIIKYKNKLMDLNNKYLQSDDKNRVKQCYLIWKSVHHFWRDRESRYNAYLFGKYWNEWKLQMEEKRKIQMFLRWKMKYMFINEWREKVKYLREIKQNRWMEVKKKMKQYFYHSEIKENHMENVNENQENNNRQVLILSSSVYPSCPKCFPSSSSPLVTMRHSRVRLSPSSSSSPPSLPLISSFPLLLSIFHWHSLSSPSLCLSPLLSCLSHHYTHHILLKYHVTQWHHKSKMSREIKEKRRGLERIGREVDRGRRLRVVFRYWRIKISSHYREKSSHQISTIIHHTRILKESLSQWIFQLRITINISYRHRVHILLNTYFTLWSRHYTQRITHFTQKYRENIGFPIIRNALGRWRERMKSEKKRIVLKGLSDNGVYHKSILLPLYLPLFLSRLRHSLFHSTLRRLSTTHHSTHILLPSLRQWRIALRNRRILFQQNVFAVWWWGGKRMRWAWREWRERGRERRRRREVERGWGEVERRRKEEMGLGILMMEKDKDDGVGERMDRERWSKEIDQWMESYLMGREAVGEGERDGKYLIEVMEEEKENGNGIEQENDKENQNPHLSSVSFAASNPKEIISNDSSSLSTFPLSSSSFSSLPSSSSYSFPPTSLLLPIEMEFREEMMKILQSKVK